METSIFIAEIIGLAWVIVGLGMLFHIKHMLKITKEFWKHDTCMYLAGVFSLVIGLLMVLSHNVWEGDSWHILLTVVGWSALVKGVILMFSPESLKGLSKKFHTKNGLTVASIVIIALGVYLLNAVEFVRWI